LGYRDFDDFGRWYTERRRRTTGRPASAVTCRNKQQRVAYAQEHFSGEPWELLGHRPSWEHFLDAQAARMTPGSLRTLVYAMRDYGDFLVATGQLEAHVVRPEDVPPQNPMPAIDVYTEAEMDRLLEGSWAKGQRWGAFINTLGHTGRRVGEVLSFRWDWLRLNEQPAHILLPETKTGEPQYVPLNTVLREEVFTPHLIRRLKEERREGRRAWHRSPQDYPFPWSYSTVHGMFDRYCDNLGVENRGFHNFRHTVITGRLAAGMPIQAVAALAGHSSVQTTDIRYNHTNALTYASLLD
jgi:integrase